MDRKPPIETLESRLMFAGVSYSNHVLIVTGNATNANTIVVTLSPDGQSIIGDLKYTLRSGPVEIQKAFPFTPKVDGIRISGGGQPDLITIDQTNGVINIPATITGGAGNDTITAGAGAAYVRGGLGNDSITGGSGNDALFGEEGNDTLIGGAGNDLLKGGRGRDVMLGGDGNDTMIDPYGPDTLFGGAGDNTFEFNSPKLDSNNDYNAEKDRLHYIPIPTGDDDSSSLLGSLFPIFNL